MVKHKAGLHKEVAKIFESVWMPQKDNDQTIVSKSYKKNGSFVHPQPLIQDNWPEKVKAARNAKAAKKAKRSWVSPWGFLSPKARREKKRISAISKQLLINLPD